MAAMAAASSDGFQPRPDGVGAAAWSARAAASQVARSFASESCIPDATSDWYWASVRPHAVTSRSSGKRVMRRGYPSEKRGESVLEASELFHVVEQRPLVVPGERGETAPRVSGFTRVGQD